MITSLCKLVTKVGFATAQLFWREHLIDGSHTSKIVITMTIYEVNMNDFYRFTHINSAFLIPYSNYMVGYCFYLFLKRKSIFRSSQSKIWTSFVVNDIQMINYNFLYYIFMGISITVQSLTPGVIPLLFSILFGIGNLSKTTLTLKGSEAASICFVMS